MLISTIIWTHFIHSCPNSLFLSLVIISQMTGWSLNAETHTFHHHPESKPRTCNQSWYLCFALGNYSRLMFWDPCPLEKSCIVMEFIEWALFWGQSVKNENAHIRICLVCVFGGFKSKVFTVISQSERPVLIFFPSHPFNQSKFVAAWYSSAYISLSFFTLWPSWHCASSFWAQ